MPNTIEGLVAPRTGRPYIGPKAQTQIYAEIHREVRKEAIERHVPMSEVWRELIEEAWAARQRRLRRGAR